MTRREAIGRLAARLVPLYDPREARSIALAAAAGISGLTTTALLTDPGAELPAAERLEAAAERLAAGEPLQYVLGEAGFCGRPFVVRPGVLIPRPETEELVAWVLRDEVRSRRLLDVGTGSGCIAVTLCAERPDWRGLMVDLSGRALAVACQNAVRHDVRQRLQPVRADFTRPLLRPESLDLLVSNPPYVGKTEYEGLSAEVRDFEPVTALVPNFVDSDKIPSHDHHHDHGGSHSHAPSTPPDKTEGLEHLIAVAQEAFVALKPGGLLLMEHGYAQGAAIKVLLESHKWENVLILKDLSGHDRVASARKPAA